jgi:hypothetical protein
MPSYLLSIYVFLPVSVFFSLCFRSFLLGWGWDQGFGFGWLVG